jgi:hypothetical protein
MKAMSLHQPWASLIATGKKTIETRKHRTHHRGPLLICSTKRPYAPYRGGYPTGVAVCIVEVLDCRPMTDADWPAACCDAYPNAWAWVLGPTTPLEPFTVRGKQGMFNVELPEGR